VKRQTALGLACVVALAASAAGASSSPIVRADGRVGSFRIDVTTEAQFRAAAGRPDRVERVFSPSRKAPAGRTLYYRCGPRCQTAYSINISTGRLSNFSTTSPRFMTARGSRVGLSAAVAARREGRRPVSGCGDRLYIHVRWDDHHQFALTVSHGRVDSIAYLGPHSVFYEGFC
jgi:hypothetical protein